MFLNSAVQLSQAVDAVQFCIHGLFIAFNNIAFVWNVTSFYWEYKVWTNLSDYEWRGLSAVTKSPVH